MAEARALAVETGLVAALNSDGEGVVRGGKTVFVAGALPGEEISFQRWRTHRGHDDGRLIEVLRQAPERVAPVCRHFGVCGGCTLQHLDHDAQLAAKDRELREALLRVGKVEPRHWLTPLRGTAWGYRRRARLGARYVNAKGRTLVGFRERLTSYVAAIDRCEVLVPQIGGAIAQLSQLISQLSVRARLPQVEVAAGDNQTALVLRILSPLTDADRQLLQAFEATHGLRFFLQAGSPEDLQTLDGEPVPLWYELPEFDLRLNFGPADFVQVNGGINRSLVTRVVELLGLDAQESRVLDLFSGLGNFTLPIARRAAAVVGIEGEAGLVRRATANAAANGLDNARFHLANLAGPEALAACRKALAAETFTHVLLDPPRTGARDVLPLVAALDVGRVVYVSCQPASLARDLGVLVHELGFVLESAGIIDMFPHTNHVESIAVLSGPRSSA